MKQQLILSVALVMVALATSVDCNLRVRCHESRFSEHPWRNALKNAFDHLRGQAGSWDDESPTLQRGPREDRQYYTRAKCFSPPHVCRRCVHHLTNISWRECGDAIRGKIANDECMIRWDRDYFEDFQVPY